jgi:hypothetical protein
MSTEAYRWWADALECHFGPVSDGDCRPGFYRRRQYKGGPWVGVAFWMDSDGATVGCRTVNGVSEPLDDPAAEFLWCCRHPVTEDTYRAYADGQGWPDDIGVGHNEPPSEGAAALADEIDSAIMAALGEIDGGIGDQTKADRAANYRDRLMKLAKAVEAERKEKLAPYNEIIADIRATYKPLEERLKDALGIIRAALTKYLKSVEDTAKAAAPVGAEVKVHAGSHGARATALRTTYAAEITDWNAALAHYGERDEIRDVVQKIANAEARAGAKTGPGWHRHEDRKAA